MKAEIKRFHSPDVDNLVDFVPPESECFGFLLQVFIGPLGVDAEESFDIVVSTPIWLAKKVGEFGSLWGRHHLIVGRYDFEAIRVEIERCVAECEGADWGEVALRLSRRGKWEFEDYQEFGASF